MIEILKLMSSGIVMDLSYIVRFVLYVCIFYVYILYIQAELRDARAVIADKVAIIEEKERLISVMSDEKKELAQKNQVCLIKQFTGLTRVHLHTLCPDADQ